MKKKNNLKPRVRCTINNFMVYLQWKNVWWGWEKKPRKTKSNEIKEKIPRLVALPSTRLRKVEAGCFPVSENTENKPDLP